MLDPVSIEDAIREIANRIGKGVVVVNRRYEEFLTADREYDRAYARAYLDGDFPAHERKHRAELATGEARQVRDVADAAFRFADRTAKALEAELRAHQSLGASVRSMYGVAGRGEQ